MSKRDRTNAQGEPFDLGPPRLTDLEARVGQVRVVVEVPGVVLHLATSAALVYALTLIVAELTGRGGSTRFVQFSWAEVGRIAAGAVLMVLSTVAHELGHVVGRRVTGSGRVEMVVVGLQVRLVGGHPSSPARAVVAWGLGPVAGLVYGVVLLVLGCPASPVLTAAGVLAALTAAGNLLPLTPDCDGSQIKRVLLDRAVG